MTTPHDDCCPTCGCPTSCAESDTWKARAERAEALLVQALGSLTEIATNGCPIDAHLAADLLAGRCTTGPAAPGVGE